MNENKELAVSNGNSLIPVDTARVMTQVKAAMVMAKEFPRDMITVEINLLKECERHELAEAAIFSYSRGKLIKGATIRLAEAIKRCYPNLDAGWNVLRKNEDFTEVEAYCLDLETNSRTSRTIIIEHSRKVNDKNGLGSTIVKITDPRDISEFVKSQAQRELRQVILTSVPGHLIAKAIDKCKETLMNGNGKKSFEDKIRDMLIAYKSIGITKEIIERKLGHPVNNLDKDEYVELLGFYNAIINKDADKRDIFDIEKTQKVSENNDAFKQAAKQETKVEPESVKEIEIEPMIDSNGKELSEQQLQELKDIMKKLGYTPKQAEEKILQAESYESLVQELAQENDNKLLEHNKEDLFPVNNTANRDLYENQAAKRKGAKK